MVKFADYDYFRPDYNPAQMFRQGIFSGMYFRPIYSSVTKKHYKDDYKQFPFLKGVPKKKLNNGVWDHAINKYKVKASTSLEFWESKNWIHPSSARGWVGWYCGFYSGKRTEDDARQISRFLGVLTRFGQRKNKSARLSQTLLHWGINPEKDHSEYIKKIKGIKRIKSALT